MKIIPFILFNLFSLQSICQDMDSARYYFNKGMDQKNAKTYLLAAGSMDKAIQYNTAFAEAYLENAFINKEMRRTDAAKKNFLKALEFQPNNKIIIAELMQLFFDYRQFTEAIELAKKCTDCANAQRILGLSFYQQEDYGQSIQYLSAYLLKNPADAEAQYTLARSYLDMEEYKKALPYFEKAVSLSGAKPLWMYELGLLYYTLFNYKSAVASFDKATNSGYIATSDFNENLGYACLYAGESARGEDLLLGIWKKKPGNKNILRDMAEIFYKQNQLDQSLKYCQQLMEIDSKDAKALYQAGLVFQKKGNKDRGQQMCDAAIAMDPSLENLRRKKEMPGGM